MKSHLGDLLKVGATFIGYDLTRMNKLEDFHIDKTNFPDILLVKRA